MTEGGSQGEQVLAVGNCGSIPLELSERWHGTLLRIDALG